MGLCPWHCVHGPVFCLSRTHLVIGVSSVSNEVWVARQERQRFPTGHSAVKLSGSIWMLLSPAPRRYVPQEAKLEKALGLSLVDQLPSGAQPPLHRADSSDVRGEGTLSVLFQTHKARGIYGSGTLALGYLLNEQVLELTSNWRLINHHITKGMGEHLHVSSNLLPTLSAPDTRDHSWTSPVSCAA